MYNSEKKVEDLFGSGNAAKPIVAGSTVNYFLSIKKGLLYLKNGMVRC